MGVTEIVTRFLNAAVLCGSCVVKLPQLGRIARARSALGLSEASFVIQALGYSLASCYAIIQRYPFEAWGESAIITLQAVGIVILIWIFRAETLHVSHRICGSIGWLALCAWLVSTGQNLPQNVISLVGLCPGGLFFVARVPQIMLNHQQGHTGELSVATHALQLLGCIIRIFTTLSQLGGDPVVLLGHGSAGGLNAILLWQMYTKKHVTQIVTNSRSSK